jgi:hypothetical protein
LVEIPAPWRRAFPQRSHFIALSSRGRDAIMPRSLQTGGAVMRSRNRRFIIVGSVLIALAIAFFLFFLSIASRSNNPAELMRIVGTVSGVVGGIAIAMIVFGSIGKKS